MPGGVIEEVGPGVTKRWKKGDRIAAFVHGGNRTEPEDGCFAEYCVATGDLGLKVTDSPFVGTLGRSKSTNDPTNRYRKT